MNKKLLISIEGAIEFFNDITIGEKVIRLKSNDNSNGSIGVFKDILIPIAKLGVKNCCTNRYWYSLGYDEPPKGKHNQSSFNKIFNGDLDKKDDVYRLEIILATIATGFYCSCEKCLYSSNINLNDFITYSFLAFRACDEKLFEDLRLDNVHVLANAISNLNEYLYLIENKGINYDSFKLMVLFVFRYHVEDAGFKKYKDKIETDRFVEDSYNEFGKLMDSFSKMLIVNDIE